MPDDANSADEVPRSRKSRRVAVACVSAALVVALILIAVWVRYSIVGGNDRPNENLTTTTDPFAHIDRNQSVDNATVASTDMNATDMNAVDAANNAADAANSAADAANSAANNAM